MLRIATLHRCLSFIGFLRSLFFGSIDIDHLDGNALLSDCNLLHIFECRSQPSLPLQEHQQDAQTASLTNSGSRLPIERLSFVYLCYSIPAHYVNVYSKLLKR